MGQGNCWVVFQLASSVCCCVDHHYFVSFFIDWALKFHSRLSGVPSLAGNGLAVCRLCAMLVSIRLRWRLGVLLDWSFVPSRKRDARRGLDADKVLATRDVIYVVLSVDPCDMVGSVPNMHPPPRADTEVADPRYTLQSVWCVQRLVGRLGRVRLAWYTTIWGKWRPFKVAGRFRDLSRQMWRVFRWCAIQCCWCLPFSTSQLEYFWKSSR